MERMPRLEFLLENLERHQAKKHVKNAVKEWLLASRSVIDSVIDTMEEDKTTPVARKINISKE
ncbi:hypothetical protein [Paenibacillus lautus]|uniref:hypothetical protein n=1 Tax=Paenibacillus lautus TaxID=1401 RepID=UPI000FD73AA5|nr:hypothetical protein [Paenibacillus lautus]